MPNWGGEQEEGKFFMLFRGKRRERIKKKKKKKKSFSHFLRFALNALVLAHYYFNAKNKTMTNQENIQELKERNELNRTILNSLQQQI